MSWANALIKDYFDFLNKKTVVFKDEKTEWVIIQTPFVGLFNDVIEIYAQKKGDRIILSDDGKTFENLNLISQKLNSAGELKNLAEKLLLNYGIQQKGGELVIEATSQNFAEKIHNLISSIIGLNKMFL